ncbi:MAG TPA: hypothetical protein VF484_02125, partial [Candidatus Limnocylindrales bacterium]
MALATPRRSPKRATADLEPEAPSGPAAPRLQVVSAAADASPATSGPADGGELRRILEDTLDNALHLLNANHAAIWLWRPNDAKPLTLAAERGLPPGIEAAVEHFRLDT